MMIGRRDENTTFQKQLLMTSQIVTGNEKRRLPEEKLPHPHYYLIGKCKKCSGSAQQVWSSCGHKQSEANMTGVLEKLLRKIIRPEKY